jgi:uncharacterized protein (TIGR02391 family)
MAEDNIQLAVRLGQEISSDLAEFSSRPDHAGAPEDSADEPLLSPADALLAEYDRRAQDPDLRFATRSRFVSTHYADAVEAGVKALNECVRARTGRTEDGDQLMTIAFSPSGGLLRINRLKSQNEISAQRGHMLLCQGVVSAWRNPRAHSIIADSPDRALMMLQLIDDLISVTRAATRTRKRKGK